MLNRKAEDWFSGRALDLEIVARMGIFSGRQSPDGGVPVADENGDAIVFPFMDGGQQVNAKFRRAGKKFTQVTGAKKTFFNADILDDPALIDGSQALVITEGEPDCLAVLTAGYPFVVSVPDGAPPESKDVVPDTADDVDPEHDTKFSFVHNNWDRLQKIKRFILFVDNDGPGNRLRDELARRIGRVRCSFVEYPDCGDKKADANEILIQYGSQAVIDTISRSMPFPIKGLYHLDDFPPMERPKLYSTGWGRLDPPAGKGMCSVSLTPGIFMVVLGKPGSGKSTWTLQMAYQVARIHHWNIALGSFEVLPVPYVRDILRNHFIGGSREDWTQFRVRAADEFIKRKFCFIYNDPKVDDAEMTLEWLLDKAADAVIRDGIKMLIIDPWNELEHARRRDETETQYTARAIRMMKKFAMAYDVLVCVVVHPTKSAGDKPQGELSLYDADGSAHWVNKPDIGLVIERDDESGQCIVHGRKFRFSFLGSKGSTSFVYDPKTETLSQ